jgi:glycosyltransferase involved in cell wall biosynthesis
MKKIIFFLCLCFGLSAETTKTICLNMIVKDESHVIERCLSSVKELIDYWVIVDTGSSDDTKEIIKNLLKDIPGELHEAPWVNFAYNRNEALKLANEKGDFILFMDADEFLVFPYGYKRPNLDKEAYLIPYQNALRTYTYYRIALIDNRLPWAWTGDIHESIESLINRPKTHEYLNDIINITSNDGRRSQDPEKSFKDAQVLEKMVEKDPNNSRNVFYLAQSYRDAGEFDLAIECFAKRANMRGCDQELFWSMYQLACLLEFREADSQLVIESYYKAYECRPSRAEPLFYLARYYQRSENYFLGYLVAKEAVSIPLSNDIMYVENWIYDYGVLLEVATCSFFLGKYQEAYDTCLKILEKENIPIEVRKSVEANLICAKSNILTSQS